MAQQSSDANLVRAFLESRDAPCPACRYNLRGAQTSTCPECGNEITLDVRLADGVQLSQHRHWLFMLVVMVWIAVGCGSGAVVGLRWLWKHSATMWTIDPNVVRSMGVHMATESLLAGAGIVGFVVLMRRRRRVCSPEAARRIFRCVLRLAWVYAVLWTAWLVWGLIFWSW
jgi:hypothetical protein